MAEGEANEVLASLRIADDCSAEFFTVTIGKAGKLERKDIGTAERNQVVLK